MSDPVPHAGASPEARPPRRISFDELVEYGRTHGANIVNGMPWSFQYNGWPVSHENDDCYLVTMSDRTLRVNRGESALIPEKALQEYLGALRESYGEWQKIADAGSVPPAPVSARVPLSEAAAPREEPRAEPRAALSEPDVAAIREDAKYATDAQSRRQIVQLCDSHESLRIALASARSALDAKDADIKEARDQRDEYHLERDIAADRAVKAESALDEAKRREGAWKAFATHLIWCDDCAQSDQICIAAKRLEVTARAARSAVSRGEADNG